MEKELQPNEQSLQNFKTECQRQNMKIEDFSNFETKRKEYAQITFDDFMQRAENDNARFDKKPVYTFLENTHIENENENKEKVDNYHQKEIEFIPIDGLSGENQNENLTRSTRRRNQNQDSPARHISRTMKIEGLKEPTTCKDTAFENTPN